MQARFTRVRDTLTPDLMRLWKNHKDTKSIHSAIGLGLVSLAKRAFNDAGKRPASWAPKKDGTPSRLRKSGTLAKSIRVTEATSRGTTIGSDRKYAAIHQLGGKTPARTIRARNGAALKFAMGGRIIYRRSVRHPGSKIPARPFLPFYSSGKLTPLGIALVGQVVRAKLRKGMA